MNDRFRFRFWDKDTQAMKTFNGFPDAIGDILTKPDRFSRYVIMQCTGLKDKNGKLIYEGDVVKDISLNMIFEVGYKKCAFYLENQEHIGYFHELAVAYGEKRLEVIGNIYENKELLDE